MMINFKLRLFKQGYYFAGVMLRCHYKAPLNADRHFSMLVVCYQPAPIVYIHRGCERGEANNALPITSKLSWPLSTTTQVSGFSSAEV
jgi:hypothetical protein